MYQSKGLIPIEIVKFSVNLQATNRNVVGMPVTAHKLKTHGLMLEVGMGIPGNCDLKMVKTVRMKTVYVLRNHVDGANLQHRGLPKIREMHSVRVEVTLIRSESVDEIETAEIVMTKFVECRVIGVGITVDIHRQIVWLITWRSMRRTVL